MTVRVLLSAALLAWPALAVARDGTEAPATTGAAPRDVVRGIPTLLDAEQRGAYRAVFASIRAGNWSDAQLRLNAMRPGPLHAIARAELYTAKGSPRIELPQLQSLLAEAPELPHAADLARLASLRGAETLPTLPSPQKLIWQNGAPNRLHVDAARTDAAAARLASDMAPHIKADEGPAAEALVEARSGELSAEALTAWRHRVAWIHFLRGDDASARRVGAVAERGTGDFVAQAAWVQGLAAWRQQDFAGAQAAFQRVSQRAADVDLRAAALYWASRADIAAGRPDLVEKRLQGASQYAETFYGMLARQALGLKPAPVPGMEQGVVDDWRALERRPNVRVAAALAEIGEDNLAASVIRHQARIGDASDYAALTRLTGRFDLPQTQLWLSHYSPRGAKPEIAMRYPAPNWTPDGGWRVDKALVYAHALQESKFDADVISPAGAYGLMQIMPAAAIDIARAKGVTIDRSMLSRPETNIEVGQSYLEKLRDMQATGGLLPKVIAAYNAGPSPVEAWNVAPRDGGDPLLYIESIPYWETRGYVMTVLRNYWMYEAKDARPSASRGALAQGMWPRFPGMKGDKAVRLTARRPARAQRSN